MEKELNIATILNDKPIGTKLWSDTFGEVSLCNVEEDRFEVKDRNSLSWIYNAYGSLDKYGGILSIFPSKQMRDWEKFAWKKGDVLKSGVDNLCIFEEWDNDSYTKFNANFITDRYNGGVLETKDWSNETDENIIKQYIAKIEEIKGGKLNLSTLEIEKPGFKDGDIVVFYNGRGCYDAIAITKKQSSEFFKVYAFLEIPIMKLYLNKDKLHIYTRAPRPATDTEKQQLFDALSKEGKRWNPETLQVEDLPKKCEFKTMDYVLVKAREDKYALWDLYQFAHKGINIFNMVGGINFAIADYKVLPYNDQTAHLLGTTDEWKH